MFASSLTHGHQLPCYFSWRLNPAAEATDAHTQNWNQIQGFANSPWHLILPTLVKIQREKAQIALIAPIWRRVPSPTATVEWIPIVHPNQENMVISPTYQEFIMPSGVPQLVVWSLSGVPADHKALQHMLHDYWRHHGEAKQHQSMNLSSNGWIAGVRNRVQIPLGVL